MDPQQNMPPINLPPINPTDGSNFDAQQPAPVVSAQPLTENSVSNSMNPAQVSAPSSAQDGDLIEKEWVNKVKEIIEKTKNDPFEQSKQLSALKADYLQKRYNKTIKLT